MKLLNSNNADVQESASLALANLTTSQVIYISTLHPGHDDVQEISASLALANLTSSQVTYINALHSGHDDVKENASLALAISPHHR